MSGALIEVALVGTLCISVWPPSESASVAPYRVLGVVALVGFAMLLAWPAVAARGHRPTAPPFPARQVSAGTSRAAGR